MAAPDPQLRQIVARPWPAMRAQLPRIAYLDRARRLAVISGPAGDALAWLRAAVSDLLEPGYRR